MTEEEKVRKEAEKLARKLGDEEWKKGETKHALEAYEASDITAVELFTKAQKLLKAAELASEWGNAYRTAEKLPTTDHDDRYQYGSGGCDRCVLCRTLKDLRKYEERIRALLEWDSQSHSNEALYRAAAVACLKLIKRMFPD